MNTILSLIVQSLYFFFPAYVANGIPVFMSRFKFLDIPIDFNKKLNNKPILGKNKTLRGFFFGILSSILFVFIQKYLYEFKFFKDISILNYNEVNILLLGFLFGFGILFGDSFKSFIKRRLNRKSGSKFMPWDQLDFMGGLIFVSLIYIPKIEIIITIVIITPLFNITSNFLAYKFGFKKVYW